MDKIRFFFATVLVISLFSYNASGQQDTTATDSLVFFHDLSYHSDFEKESFKYFFSEDSKNFIAMFLAIGDNSNDEILQTVKKSIQAKIDKYNSPSYKKMKVGKRVKKILKDVHDSYFKKYELQAYFDEIFTDGIFNCVTASALYSIIFENVDIPYAIKISTNHVYLIAYPETNSILVETTNPMEQYIVYDQHFKVKYVEYLTTIKIISEDEAKGKTAEELFNEYFYREKDISLQNLIGIQYYNRAVNLLENKKYEDAFSSFEKAYFLNPSEENGYFLMATDAIILNDCDYSDIKYAEYLAKLSRYKNIGISNDNINREFYKITYTVLVNLSDTALYSKYFNKLITEISDTTLINEIGFIYYSEMGRYLFNKSKYKESLPYSEMAYRIERKNADAENLFISNVIMAYSDMRNLYVILDSLNNYAGKYPELAGNNKFQGLRYSVILNLCNRNFSMHNGTKALEYLTMFENSLPPDYSNMDISLISRDIVNAYSNAASYYYRKGNYSKTKKYLKKGLEFIPGNYELLNKLNSVR